MDQRVTEGAESTDSLQQQEQIESAPLLTTEETGVAGVDTKGQQSEGEGEAAGLDTNLDMEVDQALTSMEGLARALCMDVDSVFEFTEKLEEMLRPSTARTDRTEEEDDDDHAAAEELRNKNAQILSKMNLLMRAQPAAEEEKEEKIQREEQTEIKIEKPKREDYGIEISKLKGWQSVRDDRALEEEEARQEIAVARVRGFLDAMRMLTRLQAWWRMMTFKMEFRAFRNARLAIKRKFFNGWRQYWAAEHMYLFHTLGKPFEAWAGETESAKQLKQIVTQFFELCVRRLRLTPQAVMCYFAPPGENSVQISETDGMKIRRLILSKLFEGWKAEVRELRGMRFKASQILARTVRRSKGPMWVKEGVLVCFHIWHRYTAVRNAYRQEAPDPQFKNPHFPQWTKLLSSITLSRIHRKRAQEKGEHLTLIRSWKTWALVMTMDKSKLLTPLQIAFNHWHVKVWTKAFTGWALHLRE